MSSKSLTSGILAAAKLAGFLLREPRAADAQRSTALYVHADHRQRFSSARGLFVVNDEGTPILLGRWRQALGDRGELSPEEKWAILRRWAETAPARFLEPGDFWSISKYGLLHKCPHKRRSPPTQDIVVPDSGSAGQWHREIVGSRDNRRRSCPVMMEGFERGRFARGQTGETGWFPAIHRDAKPKRRMTRHGQSPRPIVVESSSAARRADPCRPAGSLLRFGGTNQRTRTALRGLESRRAESRVPTACGCGRGRVTPSTACWSRPSPWREKRPSARSASASSTSRSSAASPSTTAASPSSRPAKGRRWWPPCRRS